MDNEQKSVRQTTLTAENPMFVEAVEPVISKPSARVTPRRDDTREVHLAEQITSGKRKGTPGVKTTATVTTITSDTAEYLYLTNSFIRRGIRLTTNAILRNGYEVVTTNAADTETVAKFRADFDPKLTEICDNTLIHGMQLVELFMGAEDIGVLTALIPPKEADYKKDVQNNILYTKDGAIEGYTQKRQGQVIADWSAGTVANVRFETVSGAETGISILQNAIYPAAEYGVVRGNIADSFIRGLPVVHITVTNGTSEDMAEISAGLARQFTAETVYATSDRFTMQNISSGLGSAMDVYNFTEPVLADLAACFYMPVEMLTNVKNIALAGDVFEIVYAEWIQTIRAKQVTLARILESQIYDRVTAEPVQVKFNSPQIMNTNVILKNVGFGMQSGAITAEQAQKILRDAQIFGVSAE